MYREVIGETAVWGNRALRCSGRAVHSRMTILIDAVPMKASRLIAEIVVNSHDESIVQIDINLGTRPLTVDANDGTGKSVRASSDPVYAPIVFDCF